MQDKLRLPSDLGKAVHAARKSRKLKATDISRQSGRARNILYRLERGEDVTVASLLDILRAMGLTIRLEPLGMPSLDEMRRRFSDEDDDDAPGADDGRGADRAA